MAYEIGDLRVDETVLDLALSGYIVIGNLLPNDIGITAIAKKLGVDRGSVVEVLNLLENTALDIYTFTVLGHVMGEVSGEDVDFAVNYSLGFVQDVANRVKGKMAFTYHLTLTTLMAQIDAIRRVGELMSVLGARISRRKYVEMRDGWVEDFKMMLVRMRKIYEKMQEGRGIELDDYVNVVKGYLGAGGEKAITF